MATAGSGDVLTGIVLSLLAQRYSPEEAAVLGVYLHGLAGDLAAEEMGQEALIASDITEHLYFLNVLSILLDTRINLSGANYASPYSYTRIERTDLHD